MPPISFVADIGGDRSLAAALHRLSSPEVTRAWLLRAAFDLQREMRFHVSGPRPQRLAPVTGELRRSFRINFDGLPERISVGTPLFWAEFHEIGKATPARPFALPALDKVLTRIPQFIRDAQRSAFAGRVALLAPPSSELVVAGV